MTDSSQKTTSIPSFLTRGVQQILPSAESLHELMKTKTIRVYLGIDPTGFQLTLGHAVVLRKLQQFVDAGHEVILLIGNATVRIGDPTGRDKTRPEMTDEVIEQHFSNWKEQASRVLDFSKITIKKNGDWLDALTFTDIVKLMAATTVQQLMERDMFQDRLKQKLPIFAHELIYPILQGYDSVEMEVDLEIGGNDQTFNMLYGRTMLKQMKNKEKWVLSTPLLVGNDGRKMGKSLNNFIPLADPAPTLYRKLMQVVDEVIPQYLELLTDLPQDELDSLVSGLKDGSIHPLEAKKRMAFLVVELLCGYDASIQAQLEFEKVVQAGELPKDLPELRVKSGLSAKNLLIETHGTLTSASKSECARLLAQGAVKLDEQTLLDDTLPVQIPDIGAILRVGKKHAYRVLPKQEQDE